MDILDYRNKWDTRFPDNDNFEIGAGDLREFKDDTADFFGKVSATAKLLTLDQARQLLLNQPPDPQVLPFSGYAITSPDWNAAGVDTTVFLFGLMPDAYAPTGWVVDGNGVRQPVQVDVTAGTWAFTYLREDIDLLLSRKYTRLNNTSRQSWYVEDIGQPGDGSPLLPFRTFDLAMRAAQAGDTIFYTPSGTYNFSTQRLESGEALVITQSVSVICTSPVPISASVTVLYDQFDVSYYVELHGFAIAGRLVLCKQKTQSSTFVLANCEVLAGGYIEHFGIGTDGGVDTIEVHGLRADTRGNAQRLFFFNENSGYAQAARVNLNGGTLRLGGNLADGGNGYGPNVASRLYVSANTDLELAAGAVLSNAANLVVDNRGSGPGSGGGGNGGVAGRSTHTTSAGRRYTGPIVIYNPPGALNLVAVDANIFGYAFQVNYQDVANPGYWVVGSYLASVQDVAAALAAVPAASYLLGVQVRTTIVPQDSTLEAIFYIDGLVSGNYEGSARQFLVSYTGPPLGTLNANSQFYDPIGTGWTSRGNVTMGGGRMIMSGSTNDIEDLVMTPITLYANTVYKLIIGVASIANGTTLNIGWREAGNPFQQVDYINSLGETTIYFTPSFTTGWRIQASGAKAIEVTHMYLLPA